MSVLEKTWERIQQKTFTKWCNMHLGKRGEKIEEIDKDFSNGLKLISLLEIIGAENLGKHNTKPKMKIHNIQNVNVALDYISSKGVKLWGISSEDIVDGNLKLILGMVWTIILRFAIADISEEELSAKEALLLWCKKKTAGYKDVKVENFSTSWQDGLALCALIHAHRPDLLNFDSLGPEDRAGNLKLAFDIAEKELGIPQLLDVEDVVDVPKPDERSIMAYIAQFYHVFSANRKQEIAGRRIGKLVDMTMTNDELKADYSTRAGQHAEWVKATTEKLGERDFDNTLEGIQTKLQDHDLFKSNDKPPKVADRLALQALENTIQVKLRNANRPAYNPPAGLSVKAIGDLWDALEDAQAKREKDMLDELNRQKKLDLLKRRFNIKADAMEDWINKKTAYLNGEDNVASVDEAQRRLKNLDAFDAEYERTRPRVDAVNGLKDDIVSHNDRDSDAISARAKKIEDDFNALKGVSGSKRENLSKKMKYEEDREDLRKRFANAAKEYSFWVRHTISTIASSIFPDSLQGCQEYASELKSSDDTITSNNDTKKKALDELWEQEVALNIQNDNRYTVLTNKDVESLHKSVEEAQAKRQKEYNEELARQEKMEEMRKNFANAANGFVEHVDKRTSDISSIYTGDSDASAVKSSIEKFYDGGAPEQGKLKELRDLQDEMARFGVRDNKHTDHTLPTLEVKGSQLSRFVRSKIQELDTENQDKQKYNSEAQALVDWINKTLPTLPKNFDNTLEGAQATKSAWIEYKTSDHGNHAVQKLNIEKSFESINANQNSNGRPAFVPDEALSVASINSQWQKLEEEEKKAEDSINEELARQEKVYALARQFNVDADDLAGTLNKLIDGMPGNVTVTTLDDALLRIGAQDQFDRDFEVLQTRFGGVKDTRDSIASLNYNGINQVNSRVSEIEGLFAKLSDAAKSKRGLLEEALAAEQKKETLRLDYAHKAQDYATFVKSTSDNLDDHNFGTTLEAVEQYAAELNSSDAQINKTNDEKRKAVAAAADALSAAGVSDNSHTTLSSADIDALNNQLQGALASRKTAYDAELARQKENDELRRKFASDADGFVGFLTQNEQAMRSAAETGTAEEKAEKVQGIHQKGEPNRQKLDVIVASNNSNQEKGIFTNQYTSHTVPSLEKRNTQYNDVAANLLNFIEEENEMKQRERVQEEEWKTKQEMEQQRIDLDTLCQELIEYLTGVNESFNDPIDVDTVAAVEALLAEFNATKAELDDKKSDYDHILAKEQELKSNGVDCTTEETQKAWNDTQANAEARKQSLEAELAKQQANDALRQDFAAKASTVEGWLSNSLSVLSSEEGSIEEQLVNLNAINTNEGKALVDDLEGAAQKLTSAGVTTNQYSNAIPADIKTRMNEFVKSLSAKISVLEKERLSKQHSQASPEQIEEFKEVFRHFDKKKTNTLNRLEFKSCLQSLGEDPSDSQLDGLMKSLGTQDGDNLEIGFEKFLEYMIQITSDQTTENEIYAAFRDLSGDKDFITADDLRRGGIPSEKIEYLLKEMPQYKEVEGGYDYKTWANSAFQR